MIPTTDKASYVRMWRRAIETLLDWSPELIEKWIQKHTRDLDDPLFYHESPIYYIAPLLIPETLQRRLGLRESRSLAGRIQMTIEGGGYSALPDDLDRLRRELPLADWLPLFERYRDEMVSKGLWLSDKSVDHFDWTRAKTAVQDILREYGKAEKGDILN